MITVEVPIEVGITYTNKSWYRRGDKIKEKNYVMGIFKRGVANVKSVARIISLKDDNDYTIADCISENIASGATIYTEENLLPFFLKEFYNIVELKKNDGHAKGDLHINNINNMWKDLKRQIKREHIHVSKDHLQGYCNEVAWRINNNHLSPQEKFELIFKSIATAPKLTYKALKSKKDGVKPISRTKAKKEVRAARISETVLK